MWEPLWARWRVPDGGRGSAMPAYRYHRGMAALLDQHGRTARDLRVSLTDRCNLRCTYCMPAEGIEWLPTEETLTDDEVNRLVEIAVTRLGVTKLRFTGGEPLLRKGLENIISAASKLRTEDGTAPSIALTTNALGLARRLPGLIDAGLDRVNISLDSMDPATYAKLTRRDRFQDVMAGIRAVDQAGLTPLKINSLIMRGQNEGDILALADFALGHGYELRFIEHMPLGPKHTWDRSKMVDAEDILGALRSRYTVVPAATEDKAAPATLWEVSGEGVSGRIGVIASVTEPFCAFCDRTRLTSDGQIRTCLFSREETDLRELLRGGADDEAIATAWQGAQWHKPREHGINSEHFVQPTRTMSEIGG